MANQNITKPCKTCNEIETRKKLRKKTKTKKDAIFFKGISHSFQGLHSKSKFPKHCLSPILCRSNWNDQPTDECWLEEASYYPNQLPASSWNMLLFYILLLQIGHSPFECLCGSHWNQSSLLLLQTAPCSHDFQGDWISLRASTQPEDPTRAPATNAHALDPTKHKQKFFTIVIA